MSDLHSRIPTLTDKGQVIRETYQPDGRLKDVLGYTPFAKHQLLVPAELYREIEYKDPAMTLSVKISLSDEGRYELTHLEVSGFAPISKKFLVDVPFPEIIRKAAVKAIPNSDYWLNPAFEDNAEIPDDYLAQLYWFEHLTWGSPRLAIMAVTGWSRANANYHIRRLTKYYDLPGRHAKK